MLVYERFEFFDQELEIVVGQQILLSKALAPGILLEFRGVQFIYVLREVFLAPGHESAGNSYDYAVLYLLFPEELPESLVNFPFLVVEHFLCVEQVLSVAHINHRVLLAPAVV